MKLLQASLFITAAVLGTQAKAADANYGCTAFLCFAGGIAKGGETCAQTATQVYRDIARGRGFPHCSMVDANGVDQSVLNYGKLVNKPVFPECPNGTSAIPLNTRFAVQVFGRSTFSSFGSFGGSRVSYQSKNSSDYYNNNQQVCVTGNAAQANRVYSEGELRIQNAITTKAIDIYMDGKLNSTYPVEIR